MRSLRKRWLGSATVGLVLVGAGVSVIGEAVRLRIMEVDIWMWLGVGFAGLVLLNSGLSFFGQAVRWRIHMDMAREKK